jgi:succinate dehydrogenase / fumarate reductase cytochrome b subunit
VAAIFVDAATRRRAAAATGLLLTVFTVAHAAFALGWLQGPAAFDALAGALRRSAAVRLAEIGLALVFALHVVLSVALLRDERRRPVAERRLRAPRAMAATGALLAVFLVWHCSRLRFAIGPDAFGDLDFHGAVASEVRDPRGALAYAGAALALGVHVALGLRASLDTWWPPAGRALGRTGVAWAVGTGLALAYGRVALAGWFGA